MLKCPKQKLLSEGEIVQETVSNTKRDEKHRERKYRKDLKA